MFAALVPDIHRVPAERGVEVFQVIARPPTYPPTWDYLPVCNITVNFMIMCPCQIGKKMFVLMPLLCLICVHTNFTRGSASSLSFAIFFKQHSKYCQNGREKSPYNYLIIQLEACVVNSHGIKKAFPWRFFFSFLFVCRLKMFFSPIINPFTCSAVFMATIQNLHLKLFRLWLEKENEKRRRHYQETWFQKYFVIWTIEAFSLKIP